MILFTPVFILCSLHFGFICCFKRALLHTYMERSADICESFSKVISFMILRRCVTVIILFVNINPLSVNPTKWSNTLKQFVGNLPTNCLSV